MSEAAQDDLREASLKMAATTLLSGPNCVIFDMDGTLADVAERRAKYMEQEKPNWKEWNASIGEEPPNAPLAALARILYNAGMKIVVCTGREDIYQYRTEMWLLLNDIPSHEVYCRKAKDTRPDDVVKSELLDKILANGLKPLFVVDDRDKVVAMWRERGLVCLQCAPGPF